MWRRHFCSLVIISKSLGYRETGDLPIVAAVICEHRYFENVDLLQWKTIS